MFLCGISGFVDLLRTLTGTTGELLRLVLDFLVQAIEDRENGTLEVLFGFDMRVDHALCNVRKGLPSLRRPAYLGVLSHVLEKACNSTQVLVKVMTFLQWVRNCLLLGVSTMPPTIVEDLSIPLTLSRIPWRAPSGSSL